MEETSEAAGSADSAGRRSAAAPGRGVWRFSAVAQDASVPQVRHAVRDRLLAQGMTGERYQELIDDLLLIVSELVGNSVTHAAVLSPQVVTELKIDADRVRVAVEDGHPYRPKAQPGDLGQVGGRGLLLVKSVTLQAGGVCDVEPTDGGGKVIWASLPLPGPRSWPGGEPAAVSEAPARLSAVQVPSTLPSLAVPSQPTAAPTVEPTGRLSAGSQGSQGSADPLRRSADPLRACD